MFFRYYAKSYLYASHSTYPNSSFPTSSFTVTYGCLHTTVAYWVSGCDRDNLTLNWIYLLSGLLQKVSAHFCSRSRTDKRRPEKAATLTKITVSPGGQKGTVCFHLWAVLNCLSLMNGVSLYSNILHKLLSQYFGEKSSNIYIAT